VTRILSLAVLAAAVGCEQAPPLPRPKADAKPAESATPAGGNTNYQAGAGAVQNARQAARRTVALNDMASLGKFVQAQEIELGKMPTAAEITAAVKADPSMKAIAAAIADGTIVLTGTRSKAGLWAYEVDADTKGGIGLVGGVANRYSADEITNLKRGG
jgi:hypothetical protein